MIRRIVEIFNRFCSISLDLNSFVRKYDEEILFEEDFGNELNTQAGFQINTMFKLTPLSDMNKEILKLNKAS